MNHLLSITIIGIALFVSSCTPSEHENVPKPIRTSFASKYPDVEEITWKPVSTGVWQAGFSMYHKDYTAKFNESGNWLETDHNIIRAAVPLGIKLSLHDYFKDYEIEEVFVAEKENGEFYEMEILAHGHEYEVEADADGKLLKEVEHL